jgi:hypothetical protein
VDCNREMICGMPPIGDGHRRRELTPNATTPTINGSVSAAPAPCSAQEYVHSPVYCTGRYWCWIFKMRTAWKCILAEIYTFHIRHGRIFGLKRTDMRNRKLTVALVLICLATAGVAYGQMQHYHSWQKLNQTFGQDAFGNRVVICTWKCISDYNNPHTTQTQGPGFCPHPF